MIGTHWIEKLSNLHPLNESSSHPFGKKSIATKKRYNVLRSEIITFCSLFLSNYYLMKIKNGFN
jgi:hypothetical protein